MRGANTIQYINIYYIILASNQTKHVNLRKKDIFFGGGQVRIKGIVERWNAGQLRMWGMLCAGAGQKKAPRGYQGALWYWATTYSPTG